MFNTVVPTIEESRWKPKDAAAYLPAITGEESPSKSEELYEKEIVEKIMDAFITDKEFATQLCNAISQVFVSNGETTLREDPKKCVLTRPEGIPNLTHSLLLKIAKECMNCNGNYTPDINQVLSYSRFYVAYLFEHVGLLEILSGLSSEDAREVASRYYGQELPQTIFPFFYITLKDIPKSLISRRNDARDLVVRILKLGAYHSRYYIYILKYLQANLNDSYSSNTLSEAEGR